LKRECIIPKTNSAYFAVAVTSLMGIGTLKLFDVTYVHFITLLGVVCRAIQQVAKYVTSNGNSSEKWKA
jgi:hypothetical protein